MTHARTRTSAVVVGLAAAALLAGCAGATDEVDDTTGTATAAETEFVVGMIPHHEGAVDMAEMVEGRTDRPELLALADEIVTTQQAELDQLSAIAERLGIDLGDAAAEHEVGDHGAMGMMDDQEMSSLESATDEEFDRRFIDGMIVHHEGAVTMSEEVLATDPDEEIATLAEDIITAQEAEIAQMDSWREEWDLG